MEDHPTPQPEQEPTVLELLQARIDGYCRTFNQELDLLERVTSQLAPDRAHCCGTAIEMARIAVDEIRLRAMAEPMTGAVTEERLTARPLRRRHPCE
jgi:hypothetical protein